MQLALTFALRFPWLLFLLLLSSAANLSTQQNSGSALQSAGLASQNSGSDQRRGFQHEPFFYPNVRTQNFQRPHNSAGEGIAQRSYELQPPAPSPLGPTPRVASPELGFRSQPSHYRDIYRNRNYYVKPTHKPDLSQTTKPAYSDVVADGREGRGRSTQMTSEGSVYPSYYFGNGHQYNRKQYGAATRQQVAHQWTMPTPAPTYPMPLPTDDDGPIVFSEPKPAGSYIRPVEVSSTKPHLNNDIPGTRNGSSSHVRRKDTRVNGKFVPAVDGRGAPACAKNAAYCETFDAYPKDLLNEVLSRSFSPQAFQQVYGETTDNSTTTTDLKVLERTSLTSSNGEEIPLCSSVEHTIYPRVARNKENKWMYVVNHDEYIQGVRVEKCLDEDQPCVFGDSSPPGYQTVCRQKYIYKKLLALTPEGKTSTDTFKLPSCCVCFVKKVSLSDRWLGSHPTSSSALKTTEAAGVHPAPESVLDETQHSGFQSDEAAKATTLSHSTSPKSVRRRRVT